MATWDYVCYEAETKELLTIVSDLKEEPKYLVKEGLVGVYIPNDEYKIIEEKDGKCYFKSLNNLFYIDEYRGRYEE